MRSNIKQTDKEIVVALVQQGRRDLAREYLRSTKTVRAAGKPETRKHPKRDVLVEVTPGKFGFSAWIVSKQGKRGAPLSISRNVKTIDEAFDVAFKTIDRVG